MNLDQGTESLHPPDFSKQLTEIQDKGCTLIDKRQTDLRELNAFLTVHRELTIH